MPIVVMAPNGVASFPEGGGLFWVYMQYALGLQHLGCEVFWLEAFPVNGQAEQDSVTIKMFRAWMKQFGFDKKLILYTTRRVRPTVDSPNTYIGKSRDEAEEIFASADLLVNFQYAMSPDLLSRFRRTALVDIDPGLLQFWISRGQLAVSPHDFYFTIGEHVGERGGNIPDCGVEWCHIRPAVFLEMWPYTFDRRCESFTTVSIWDSRDWMVDRSEKYENTKRVAFMKLADLPRLTNQPLELALFLKNTRDFEDRRSLEQRGWRIRNSGEVAGTPEMYQAYVQQSRGEFSCAKPAYTKLRTAWISDRTVCYLASGKPAVVQDTGPSSFLPNGEGMFRFSTPQEAAAALESINADYERHCRAARELAETYFDAKLIVGKLLMDTLS